MTRRNRWKWALLVTSILFFICSFAFFVIYGLFFECPHRSDICRTGSCVVAGSEILQKLDQAANPCRDFYQFACGSYLRDEPIPGDEEEWSTIRSTVDAMMFALNGLLKQEDEEVSNNTDASSKAEMSNNTDATSKAETLNDTDATSKAKIFYNSCIKGNRVKDEASIAAVRYTLTEAGVEDWPILDPYWNRNDIDLEKRLAVLIVHRAMPFFDMRVSHNSSRTPPAILKVTTGKPVLETEYYLSFELEYSLQLQVYREFMSETLRHLGVAEDRVRRDILDMIAFETRFANLTKVHRARVENDEDNETERLPVVELYNVSQLTTMMPEIDWTLLIKYLCDNLNVSNCSINEILLDDVWSMKDLLRLLEDTPRRILASYMMWRFLYQYMDALHGSFRRLYYDFMAKHFNSSPRYLPVWKECSEIVHHGMSMVTTSLFVEHELNAEKKLAIHKMAAAVKKSFMDLLKSQRALHWDKRYYCMEKIKNIEVAIGYDNAIFDPKIIDDYYDRLDLRDDHFMRNFLRFNKFVFFKNLEPVLFSKEIISGETAQLQAKANITEKNTTTEKNMSIVLPLEVLLPPFFSPGQQGYQNYGMLGTFIGYQIMKELTKQGDPMFDLDKRDWPEDREYDDTRAPGCFEKRFLLLSADNLDQKSKIPSGLLNSLRNERIGLEQSYTVYQKQAKDEPQLPGLDFTSDQMFFIVYGQMMCKVGINETSPVGKNETSPSSGYKKTSRNRVNRVIKTEHFKKAFEC